MEWTESIRKAILYLEGHLLDERNTDEVAKHVGISPIYLQKGFKFMTGYSMAEYVRNRRLYHAALDVISDRGKVIDIAYRYGYDTPESFTKAFARFHGVPPMQLKKDASKMQVFLPLKIRISILGGMEMDYVVERMQRFCVIGFERKFSYEEPYLEIPKFWDEIVKEHFPRNGQPKGEVQETVARCHIGEFGVCIDDGGDGQFRYLIAGTYDGGVVPEGMVTYELPDMEWAKFACKGPMPGALQSVNTKLFKEWLPGNPSFEIAMGVDVEWYSMGDMNAADYESAIWIPVKRK